MNVRKSILALVAVVGIAAVLWWTAWIPEYSSQVAVFNADTTLIRVSRADSLAPAAELIAAKTLGRRWPIPPRRILIERDIPGADVMMFDLLPYLPVIGGDFVLALRDTMLYVVSREKWPRTPPNSDAALRALALATVPPLH